MLNNHASDVSGNGRIASFLVSSSHATEESLGRTQIVHRTFTLLGRSNAFIACFVLVLFLAMSSSARLAAQTSGVISGHVADATGAVIPDANVTLTNVGTSAERSTVTTGAGDYTFPDVPPAIYKVSVTHAGFKTETSEALELQVEQSLRQDFTMQVGAVTATVTVEATGAMLQAENASLGTVIENQAINEMPLNGRNYLSLIALSSNVNTISQAAGQAGSRLGGDRGSQSISVGGQRIMWNYFTLDGLNNTDPDFVTYVGLPSLDGIQEFKVQTGVYPAEFGHEASQVNVLSKSGTNTYHGSMYDFIRNNTADANPYWFPYNAAPAKVYPYKWNDYGFELDGAIRIPKIYNGRDKFFFMVDDEWRKIRTVGQGSATVPSPAIAGGDFSSFTTASGAPVIIYDPATGDANGFGKTQVSCNGHLNVICSSRIAAPSLALEKYLGSSTQPYYSGGKQVANYAYPTTGPQDRQGLTVRGDFIQSQKSQYAFRYSSGNEDILSTGFMGAGSKIFTQYYQYMGSNTWTFTPHIVNEARFGYSHFFNSLGLLSAYTNDVVDAVAIPNLKGGAPSTWGIPDVSFSTGPTGTTPAIWQEIGDVGGDGPYVVTDPTWEIVDNLSWVRGKHSIRFGFEYNKQTFNQLGNQFSRGQFFTKPLATALQSGAIGSATLSGGDAFADFLFGDLYQSVVAVAVANANYVRNVQAYYADDTYKIRPNFTISAGIRYELTPPWNDTFGNNFTVDLPVMPKITDTSSTYAQSQWPFYVRQGSCTPANVYSGLAINWTASSLGLGSAPVCSNGTLPNGPLLKTQYLNFAPRLALSYSPRPTLVVRLGYGIFYSQDIGNAYFDMARNIAGRVTTTNTDSTTNIYGNSNLTWANAAPGGSGGTTVNLPASTTAFVDALEHKTTYTEQYLVNIQKQFGQDWTFELGYQGAGSKHLYGFINANVANPYGYTNGGTATSVASRTPFANMGGIQYVQDWGSGNYNAFSVKATRRFSKGLNVNGSYTWGKSLDDTSGVRSQGNDELFPQNNRCVPCDYGPSAFNVKNRLVGSALYQLPIGPGMLVPVNNKALDAIIGGWQIGGIFTHQTGQAGTVILGYDNSSIAAAGGNFDRPNPTGTSPYFTGISRSLNTWLNKAAYTPAPAGYFGSLTRGTIIGPGFTNFDASLHKTFNMPYNEKHQLAIRFEAFNALNHPNWGLPTLAYNSSTFGRIGGTSAMRQLQLAAKYQF